LDKWLFVQHEPELYNFAMNPAIFLDRDGVIIENRSNYVRSWDDVYIYPQALKALVEFSKLPFYIVIVTNQSAIGRGIITKQEADAINDRLVNEIGAAGGRIDAVYICPHAPADNCQCRKPEPGFFLQAAQEFPLSLNNSVMVGDALTDLMAAEAAGIAQRILVRTGRGEQQLQLNEASSLSPYLIYDTLLETFKHLLQDKP
jgi:D-glycero-D-manno-heptose 1,7-bisphosphate phosphatase